MEISKIKSKLGNLLGVFAFKILMELAYIYCIVVTWDNLQFYYKPEKAMLFLSLLFCHKISFFYPLRKIYEVFYRFYIPYANYLFIKKK